MNPKYKGCFMAEAIVDNSHNLIVLPSNPTSEEESLCRLQAYVDYHKKGAEITGDLVELGVDKTKYGKIHHFGMVTKAGFAYGGHVSIPNEPISDIPVTSTAAWVTGPLGHNEHNHRLFMQDGIPGIHLANEGSFRPGLLPPVPKQGLYLATTAAASLSFNREIGERFAGDIHPVLRTAAGESKGAMEGKATMWLDQFFGLNYLMANFTAGCIPRRPELRDLPKFAEQIKDEPAQLIQLAGRLTLGLIFHTPSTIDLHPYAVVGQIAKAPAIFSGETGDHAKMINHEKLIHMTTFHKDAWSMMEEWLKIYEGHPNARITPLDGSHLTLADPETQAYTRAREKAFRELFERSGRKIIDNDGNQQFTGDDVFDLAHEYVPQFMKDLPSNPIQKVVRFIFGNHSPAKALEDFTKAA
jgi:hypothetical protein